MTNKIFNDEKPSHFVSYRGWVWIAATAVSAGFWTAIAYACGVL